MVDRDCEVLVEFVSIYLPPLARQVLNLIMGLSMKIKVHSPIRVMDVIVHALQAFTRDGHR